MKLMLELPDSALAAVVCYVDNTEERMLLVNKPIGTTELQNGYKDCREYEVLSDENA